MDQKTYSDETVIAVLRDDFIAVKVDHDARSDLANRYRNFGWPATIILNSDPAEGPLPNPDVQYPSFEKAAAFVCTDGRCSIPAFAAEQYAELIARIGER